MAKPCLTDRLYPLTPPSPMGEGVSVAMLLPRLGSNISARRSGASRHAIRLVLVEQAHRLFQRVAAERITKLLGDHDLDDGRLARGCGGPERIADHVGVVDLDAFGAHRLGDAREAGIVQIAAD